MPNSIDLLEDNSANLLTSKGQLLTFSTTQTALSAGTNDYVLTADSSNANGIAYKDPQTLIDAVTRSGTTNDNRIARWDGNSADTIQNSAVSINDDGDVSGVGDLTMTGDLDCNTATATGGLLVSGESYIERDDDATDECNLNFCDNGFAVRVRMGMDANADNFYIENQATGINNGSIILRPNSTSGVVVDGLLSLKALQWESTGAPHNVSFDDTNITDSGTLVQGSTGNTDNAIVRWDGTGRNIQNSGWTIDDNDDMTAAGDLDMNSGGISNVDSIGATSANLTNLSIATSGTITNVPSTTKTMTFVWGLSQDITNEVTVEFYKFNNIIFMYIPSMFFNVITHTGDDSIDCADTFPTGYEPEGAMTCGTLRYQQGTSHGLCAVYLNTSDPYIRIYDYRGQVFTNTDLSIGAGIVTYRRLTT